MALNHVGSFSPFPQQQLVNKANVAAADSAAVYLGDPVKITGVGLATGEQVVTLGDGAALYGVMTSVYPQPSTPTTQIRTASTSMFINVCVDPYAIYQVTEDGSGGFMTLSNVGDNCSLVNTGSAGVDGINSAAVIHSSTAATTVTLPWKILGLARTSGNATGTTSTIWEVTPNLHFLKAGVVGV